VEKNCVHGELIIIPCLTISKNFKVIASYQSCEISFEYEKHLFMTDIHLHLFLQTAMLYPSVMFGTCFVLNLFIWGKHSSGAVSIVRWMFISNLIISELISWSDKQ